MSKGLQRCTLRIAQSARPPNTDSIARTLILTHTSTAIAPSRTRMDTRGRNGTPTLAHPHMHTRTQTPTHKHQHTRTHHPTHTHRYTATILPALHLQGIPTGVTLCTRDAFVCANHVIDHLSCGDFAANVQLAAFEGVHGSFLVNNQIRDAIVEQTRRILAADAE
jgi:hypothetical protein